MKDILENFARHLKEKPQYQLGLLSESDIEIEANEFANERIRTLKEIKELLDKLNVGVCDWVKVGRGNDCYRFYAYKDEDTFYCQLPNNDTFCTIEELGLKLLKIMYDAKVYFASIEKPKATIEQPFFNGVHESYNILVSHLIKSLNGCAEFRGASITEQHNLKIYLNEREQGYRTLFIGDPTSIDIDMEREKGKIDEYLDTIRPEPKQKPKSFHPTMHENFDILINYFLEAFKGEATLEDTIIHENDCLTIVYSYRGWHNFNLKNVSEEHLAQSKYFIDQRFNEHNENNLQDLEETE